MNKFFLFEISKNQPIAILWELIVYFIQEWLGWKDAAPKKEIVFQSAHLAHVPMIKEQNDFQCVLYPLSVLAAPSTDRQTPIL